VRSESPIKSSHPSRLNWTSRIKASNILCGRSRSIRKYIIRHLVIHTIPRRIRRPPMGYPSHLRRDPEHTRDHVSLTPRYRLLSRTCRFPRPKHMPRSTSHRIRLGSRHPRLVPRATQRWTSTKIHVLDRVLRKRGIVRVSAKRSVLESESAIETGNENGTETETEIGSRDGMAQGAVVVRAAETVGSITHTRVEIGRWRKEWDFETVFLFTFTSWKGHIVYLVRKITDLDVSLADKLSSRPVSVTYRRPS